MAPRWELLNDLAERVVGEPVAVAELDAEAARLCQAQTYWNGQKYCIRIDPSLGYEDLVKVFFHELGHLALGHVRKNYPHVDVTLWPAAWWAATKAQRKGIEAAADRWAEAALKSLDPPWANLLAVMVGGEG